MLSIGKVMWLHSYFHCPSTLPWAFPPTRPHTHWSWLKKRFNWANENLLASDWNQKAIEVELKNYIWILDTHFHLDTKKEAEMRKIYIHRKREVDLVSGREHNFSLGLNLNLCGFLLFATDYSVGQPLKWPPVILTFGYSTLCNSFSWNVHWIYCL